MTDRLNGHIGDAALATLLEEFRMGSAMSVSEFANTNPHLSSCPVCRVQFEGLALLQHRRETSRPPAASSSEDCKSNWLGCVHSCRQMALGLPLTDRSRSFIAHASRCEFCGSLLRDTIRFLADLNQEISASEQEYVASLQSGSAEWHRYLAQRLTARLETEPAPIVRRWRALPRLALAGACILVFLGLVSWWVVGRGNNRAVVADLLSRTYSENRALELRIVGGRYAPLRVSRGVGSFSGISSFTRRRSLLKAEGLIGSELAAHPSDSSWLQAAGQAAILDGKYDEAIAMLRRAVQVTPHTPAPLTDLATAFFQRGDKQNRQEDFGAAYECLSAALRVKPDDPVALFNRAIVGERQFLYHQALADWEQYLQVDAGSEWTEEARDRMNTVSARVKEHESKPQPLLSPAQVAVLATTAVSGSDVEQRLDQYLREALRAWLPQAYQELTTGTRANDDGDRDEKSASHALRFLAKLSNEHRGDQWLRDLLSGSSSPHFSQAANALAGAVHGYGVGDYNSSRQQAEVAEKTFRASGNMAGALYAELFQTLNDQVSGHSENCRRQSIIAEAEASRYAYPWLQGQLELQEGVCAGIIGDLGAYERAAQRALDLAQRVGDRELYLRAVGLVADSKFAVGDRASGLNSVSAGLKSYWSAPSPDLYAYNLYFLESDSMDEAGQPNLLLAIRREALAKIDNNANPLQRAEGHSILASAAAAAGQPVIADQEYQEAARLYALAPPSAANGAYRFTSEVRVAQVETRQGSLDAALARLRGIQSQVQQLSNNVLAEMFYATLGEAELRSDHAAEAERAFRSALPLAERSLRSVRSEAERTSWTKDATPIYLGLAEAELLQGREQDSLDIFEWYLGAPQRVGKPGDHAARSAPDPARLAARLPLLTNQTVLAYAKLPDGLAIWVYDNRGVTAKWIARPPQELQDLAADFYEECSDPSSDLSALRRDGQALYSQLIAPVVAQLDPTRTLVIETDGSLARLPFEALVDPSGHYLIERGPIVHSRGLYAEARMHPDATISSASPALIVGSTASAPNEGLFVIPNLLAGAEMVANLFHAAHTIKGVEATVPAVAGALPGAVVFHFAGHAITTSDRTGLMLEGIDAQTGGPPVLDADLVRRLRLTNMQLAILAACNTDSGQGTSRGFDSVAGAFETSGVPHVIASRWGVESVQPFVGSFYQSLLSGELPSHATWITSRKLLSNPHTAHPYYWAAFAAYGRP